MAIIKYTPRINFSWCPLWNHLSCRWPSFRYSQDEDASAERVRDGRHAPHIPQDAESAGSHWSIQVFSFSAVFIVSRIMHVLYIPLFLEVVFRL